MRKGIKANIILLDGVFIGFDLSADACAEHEWKLDFLKAFGVGTKKGCGIDRMTTTKVPRAKFDWAKDLAYIPGKESYLVYANSRIIKRLKEGTGSIRDLQISPFDKTGVTGAWDGDSFGVVTDKYHDELKELHEAFQKKDVVMGRFDGDWFDNAGLKLLIASKIPEYLKKEWYASDKDKDALEKAAEKTGIYKLLEKAGKKYMALSPSWIEEKVKTKKPTSKHSVMFWLNPDDQQTYTYGWFTVEDLEEWAEDKGPCIKENR